MTTSRLGAAAVLLATMACAGCVVSEPSPPDDELSELDDEIAFVFPRDGFFLSQADDADGDMSNGIQIDPPVRVAYTGDVSRRLTLSSDEGEEQDSFLDDDGFVCFRSFTVGMGDLSDPGRVELTVTDRSIADVITVQTATTGN